MTRKWEVLSVMYLADLRYSVLYLLDDKERRHAMINATLGLEHTITEAGKLLAMQPPMERPPVGIKKRRFPFRARSTSDQTDEI